MKENNLFKATISFEDNKYMDIILYLLYNGKNKLKNSIPQIKFKIWGKKNYLTVDITNLKIVESLKKIKKDDKRIIDEVLKYVKEHQQLLLDYWNADIKEFEAKQIFYEEKKEHFGCCSLSGKITNLPMNLLLYCSYTLDRDNIIFFQNDYGPLNYNNMIMMSVDKDDPYVLVDRKINIKEEDIVLLKEFIKKNYEVLTNYNNDELEDSELFEVIQKIER